MRRQSENRHGIVLVMFVLTIVALFTFVALAVDLGMVAMARTQCQAAADAAALAGCRALNGNSSSSYNYSSAEPDAVAAATNNKILGASIPSSDLTVNIGRYSYNSTAQQFQGNFPGSAGNWTMVQAQVTANLSGLLAFSKILNVTPANITTTATAIHRPRDICVVLDYSGSMRFASLAGDPYYGDRTCNNPDTVYPQFGHYSSTGSNMYATAFSSPYDAANITTTTSDGRPPIVQDFYSDANGTAAWTAAPSSYATAPAGDKPLMTNKNAGGGYAQTLAQVLNIASPGNSTYDSTFESQGYMAYSMATQFYRYTQGPRYYGKTFFIWPPDPANGSDGATNDWRKRYFYNNGTATALSDNARLWDNNGNWRTPGSNSYSVNYTAILNWIKNIGPSVFPSTLRSGRIVYYTTIPSSITLASNAPPANLDERFWKEYIDYCLGFIDNYDGSYQILNDGSNGLAGYGYDDQWGTVKITAASSLSGSPKPFMHYGDNPLRGRLHFWFGPLSMVDFLGNYNIWYYANPSCSRFCWWPGTCHESPMYACKLGIQAALTDIQNNHPNDQVSLIMFSVPRSTAGENDDRRFNRVRVGLGQSYSNMIESLWYPPATVGNSSATVTPYDSNNIEVPRAEGGTCYSMGLMLAYNQFSANTSLLNYSTGQPTGDAGGNGRKGAQKIIIFETDGAPNTTATAAFQNSGSYNSYYKVRYNYGAPTSSEFPSGISGYSDNSSTVVNQVNGLVSQLAALDSAAAAGYSTSTKPLLLHCIGFGPQFDPSTSTSTSNKATLSTMQSLGNVTDGMPDYKIIYGDQASVVSDLQQAFTKILQTGVQVSLIQ